MPTQTSRSRFIALLENKSSEKGGSLSDLLFPPSELLSLIPSGLRPQIKLFSENVSTRWGVDDIFTFLGGYCVFRICTLLLEEEPDYSLASGYLLVYLRYFIDDKVFTEVEGMPKLLAVLTRDHGTEKDRVIAGNILPVLQRLKGKELSAEKFKVIRDGHWFNPSKSYSYVQVNDAVEELIHNLTGLFPALNDYLNAEMILPHTKTPVYDLREHFLSDDEIFLLADDVISRLPRGDIEYRSWYRLLNHKIFCHLVNKRHARRTLKTIFLKMDTHHIELDLLCRQRRFLLARLRGVIPDPVIFLDQAFGTLCIEKLREVPLGVTDIAFLEADLKNLHPEYLNIFDRISKGVFFLDLESNALIMDWRSAMFHAAYSFVECLDSDHGMLPKLSLDHFDIYSFAGRIAMDTGRKSRLIHYSRKLMETSRKKHGVRNLLVAGSLLLYADLHPQDQEYSEVHKTVVGELVLLWERRVPPRILDRAAEILNIIDRNSLERRLDWDLKRHPVGSNLWNSAIRRYAYLEHPVAMDVIREIIDSLTVDDLRSTPFEPEPGPVHQGTLPMVCYALFEFSSPYREVLLEYFASHCHELMRQCIYNMARSNSLPALRRLKEIASFRPTSLSWEMFHYSRRMLNDYATPARTAMILRQIAEIRSDHQSQNPFFYRRADHIFGLIGTPRTGSALQKYRSTPIALGRYMVSLLSSGELHAMQERSLLISLRTKRFWPALDLLLPLHARFLANGAPADMALFYREALMSMSDRNNAPLLEKELASADKPNYQALLLECLGNSHGLRLDALFEHYYSNASAEIAIAALNGLTASIGIGAEDRLETITVKDPRPVVRENAFWNLARIPSPHALSFLEANLKRNPKDARSFSLLTGYALPSSEKMMVDAIQKINPGDQWLFYSFLFLSGGKFAIRGYRDFAGRNPGPFLEDHLSLINPASATIAIDEWLSAGKEEAEEWLVPVISILAQSSDPRCIPVLLEFAYKSINPRVRSAAIKYLTEDMDYTKCPSSIEIILTYSGYLRKSGRYPVPNPYSPLAMEEISRNMKRDRDILSAYLRSFKKKKLSIPMQWKNSIPRYILADSFPNIET